MVMSREQAGLEADIEADTPHSITCTSITYKNIINADEAKWWRFNATIRHEQFFTDEFPKGIWFTSAISSKYRIMLYGYDRRNLVNVFVFTDLGGDSEEANIIPVESALHNTFDGVRFDELNGKAFFNSSDGFLTITMDNKCGREIGNFILYEQVAFGCKCKILHRPGSKGCASTTGSDVGRSAMDAAIWFENHKLFALVSTVDCTTEKKNGLFKLRIIERSLRGDPADYRKKRTTVVNQGVLRLLGITDDCIVYFHWLSLLLPMAFERFQAIAVHRLVEGTPCEDVLPFMTQT
ncbi:hypothetical protein OSTOST_05260, partial [Ostertagia ostertagi]